MKSCNLNILCDFNFDFKLVIGNSCDRIKSIFKKGNFTFDENCTKIIIFFIFKVVWVIVDFLLHFILSCRLTRKPRRVSEKRTTSNEKEVVNLSFGALSCGWFIFGFEMADEAAWPPPRYVHCIDEERGEKYRQKHLQESQNNTRSHHLDGTTKRNPLFLFFASVLC